MSLSNLPDFVSKKIDMLTAAKMFKKAIDENCKRMGMDPDWETEEFNYDRNDMFVGVAEEFLSITGGDRKPTCNLDDGIRVLAVIEAARQSSSTEKVIKLDTLNELSRT